MTAGSAVIDHPLCFTVLALIFSVGSYFVYYYAPHSSFAQELSFSDSFNSYSRSILTQLNERALDENVVIPQIRTKKICLQQAIMFSQLIHSEFFQQEPNRN